MSSIRVRVGQGVVGLALGTLLAASAAQAQPGGRSAEDAPADTQATVRRVTAPGPTPVTVFEIGVEGTVSPELLQQVARRLHAQGLVADLNGQAGRMTVVATEGDADALAPALRPGVVRVAAVVAEPGQPVPPGAVLAPDAQAPGRTWALSPSEGLVFEKPAVTVGQDPMTRHPLVELRMVPANAEAFGALTGRLVGRKMAVLVDDVVYTTPVVREPIPGGRVQIHLGGAAREAERLASALDGGPLPARLVLKETWAGLRHERGGRTEVKAAEADAVGPDAARPDAARRSFVYGTPTRWDLAACRLSKQPTCRIATAMILGAR